MRLIPSMSSTELNHLARGWFGKLVVIALVAVPTIYAGLLVYSNIDVTNHLDAVPAAIVNEDRPATTTDADGKRQPVALGRAVTGKLVDSDSASNLDWRITDAEDARAGLDDGTYYAVLTIPKDFSADAVSSADPDRARAARIDLKTNDATSYLAGNIAQAVSREVTKSTGDQLTEQYLSRVFLGFNELHEQMGTIASASKQLSDGTGQLATSSVQLDDGAHQLSGGVSQVAAGNAQLADGLGAANSGAQRLQDGIGTLAAGNRQLADGLGTMSEQTAQLPQQSAALAAGTKELSAGNKRLADGATQLAGGLDRAADTTEALPGRIQQLAQGADRLSGGVTRLAGAANGLAQGATSVAQGGKSLAEGADRVASGAAQVRTGTDRLAEGAGDLATSQRRLADGTREYTRSVDALAAQCADSGADAAFCDRLAATAERGDDLRTGSAAAATGAATLNEGADTLARSTTALSQGADPLKAGAARLQEGSERLATGAGSFAQGTNDLTTGATRLGDGLEQFAAQAPTLGSGVRQAADAAQQVAAGTTKLADGAARLSGGLDRLAAATPTLVGGINTAATSADKLADGAETIDASTVQLTSGIGQAAAASRQLADGSAQAAAGAKRLDEGIGRLVTGVAKLDDGATQLADGTAKGVEAVPTYDSDQRSRLGTVVASPVGSDDTRLHRVPTYGAGMAPYFLSLGLWVGGMALFFMIRPYTRRSLATAASSWRIALAGFATPALLGVVQAVVVTTVLRFWVGIDMASPWRLLAFAVLASVTFVAINQALNALLGPAGRFLGLIITVFQLSAAGATYPIESSPGFFQAVHPLLPLTYTVRAFRSLIAGGDLHLASAAAVLCGWLVAALLVSAFAVHRARTWQVAALRPAT